MAIVLNEQRKLLGLMDSMASKVHQLSEDSMASFLADLNKLIDQFESAIQDEKKPYKNIYAVNTSSGSTLAQIKAARDYITKTALPGYRATCQELIDHVNKSPA